MRKITTIIIVAILAISCSLDNPDEGIVNVDLEGNWVLDDISCFCDFKSNIDFSEHRISFSGSKLTVLNEGDGFNLRDKGKYNYTVEGNLITFPDGEQYRYQIDNQQLYLTIEGKIEISDDEISYIYYKK